MPEKKIAILGHGRSGKDTAAEFLDNHTPLRYGGSTSEYLCPFVAAKLGIPEQEAFRRRHESDEMRMLWYDAGNELRRDDPLFLVRRVLADGDLVVGLRDAEEVARLPEIGVDLLIWIHRDVPVDPTCKFGPEDCDVVVHNTHPTDPTPMLRRLRRLVVAMGIPCEEVK